MEWQRPIGEFPRVWHRFTARDRDSDKLVNYVIQDVPEDRFEEAYQFMETNFMPDEPLTSAVGVLNCPVSRQENAQLAIHFLNKKMSLACFKESTSELVAVNVLHVSTVEEGDLKLEVSGESLRKAYGVYKHVMSHFDQCKAYNVDKYLSALGLGVHRDYRRRGIAVEMLKTRVPLCKAFGIPLTTTFFTAIGSQIAAAKAGFEDNFEFNYADLPAVNPAWNFPDIKTKSIKIQSMKIN